MTVGSPLGKTANVPLRIPPFARPSKLRSRHNPQEIAAAALARRFPDRYSRIHY